VIHFKIEVIWLGCMEGLCVRCVCGLVVFNAFLGIERCCGAFMCSFVGFCSCLDCVLWLIMCSGARRLPHSPLP
jgi:hypothetical protein